MTTLDRAKSLAAAPNTRAGAKRTRILVDILKYTVLVILAASWLFPFYWMFTSALKDDTQIYTIPPVLIPNPAWWGNFYDAWTRDNFTLYALNSIFRYCIPVTVLTVLSSSVVAYGFARIRWRGREALFYICLATMMIPFQVTMVPLFVIFKNLGWINTYYPLVVPALFGTPFFIFMLRQFFLGIPEDLSEAARMDGANELRILTSVILPLSVPALTVVALFQFLWAWNDYLGPLIYLHQDTMYPLALGIARLGDTISSTGASALAYPYLMAVSTIMVAPILALFFLAQKQFIEGISVTGIKG